MTRDQLTTVIARVTGVSHEDIQGLPSLAVLRVVNLLRVQGLPVTYEALASNVDLEAWWNHVDELQRRNPHLAA